MNATAMAVQSHIHTIRTRVFLQRKDGRVLMMVRNLKDRVGYDWFTTQLPGGGQDYGETAEQTVIRETFEELMVMIQPEDLQFIHLYNHTRDADDVEKAAWPGCETVTNEFHFFLAKLPVELENEELVMAEPEKFATIQFCNREEIDQLVNKYKLTPSTVSNLGDGIADALESVTF